MRKRKANRASQNGRQYGQRRGQGPAACGDVDRPAPSSPPGAGEDAVTRRNIDAIIRSEESHRNTGAWSEVLAEGITRFCGSMLFVWVHLAWFAAWSVLNLALPKEWRWDPWPFPFLTLVVSLEAIFLSTFILISERRDAVVAARRAHLDLQINLLAEQENTRLLKLIERIAQKLGVDAPSDPESRALAENTRPEKVLRQIDERLAGEGR